MKKKLATMAGVILLAIPHAVCGAQPEPVVEQPAEMLAGEEVPRYQVIRAFLDYAIEYEQIGGKVYMAFLRKMGVTPGTVGQEYIEAAIRRASEVVKEPLVDPSLSTDPEAYRDDMRARSQSQAQRIGQIYGELLTALDEGGMPIPGFEAIVDHFARPTIGINIYAEGEEELIEERQRFQELDTTFKKALAEAYDAQ